MDNRINLKINDIPCDLEIKIAYRLIKIGFILNDIDSRDYYFNNKEQESFSICFEGTGVLCSDLELDETVKIFNLIQDVINTKM